MPITAARAETASRDEALPDALPPPYVEAFDSSSAMLRAVSRFLRGLDFPEPDRPHPLLRKLLPIGNGLPYRVRQGLYSWAGWVSASAASDLGRVRDEEIADWIIASYPRRRYPVILVGAANGAAVHLAAALRAPWIPQTVLVPFRRARGDRDDLRAEMERGRHLAPRILDENPSLELHHMADPNQDRLMLRRMGYFRLKRLALGPRLERFVEDCLEPGGSLVLVDCELPWPTRRIAERHYWQTGGLGGLEPEEYLRGSPRVTELLRRSGSSRRRWDAPEPDAMRPEAEWGFAQPLGDDVIALAARLGASFRRLAFRHPEDLSPFVADLHRHWYRERRLPVHGLLVESFLILEPFWALRTGSVPFWTAFPVEPSARALEKYLEHTAPYDHIHTVLFSHGLRSVGLAGIDRWRQVMSHARRSSGFLGVDPDAFPADFAVLARYQADLKRAIAHRSPMPAPLTLAELERFAADNQGRYAVALREA